MPGGVRVKFKMDASKLTLAIARYLNVVSDGESRSKLVADQMRFAIRAILDLTPPETLAQGRKAVQRDITLAMSPWGGKDGQFSGIRSESLRERLISYQQTGQYDKMKQIWAGIGGRSSLQLLDFEPALHHRVQDSRGHVNSDQHIMVPQLKAWKAYVARIQGQVGRARGGWAQSAALVGLPLPQWVTRHAEGGVAYKLINPKTVTFVFINRSVFVPRYRQSVETALEGRVKAMETDARRFLAGAATHAGFRQS